MSWSNDIRNYANKTIDWAKKEIPYYAGKTYSGVQSGVTDLAKLYGVDDAVKSIAETKVKGYEYLAEKGLLTMGKAGKFITKKFVPGANVYFTGKDVWTFYNGFKRGWNAYGR